MVAKLLAGAPVAEAVLQDVQARVARLSARGRRVGLGVILAGDDAASAGYVRKKEEACRAIGIAFARCAVPASASQGDLLAAVDDFNRDRAIDGYLIQHPLPSGLDFNQALLRMDPDKDADGLHPTNLGRLVLQEPGPVPATPAGIVAMLRHYGIEVAGREVVIIGRGPTLGRPLSLLLASKQAGADAAVTVVHSAVRDLRPFVQRADVVIAAVGKPEIVTADMVKPGAVAISGGITWRGRTLLPDVSEGVAQVASWITPRLGGVGVTTVALLLQNLVTLAERRAD